MNRTNLVIRALDELRKPLRDERGGAIIMAILVSMVVLGAGALALTVSRNDMRITANHNRGVLAKYHAESQLQRSIGLQNDLTQSPRWLRDGANYAYRATGVGDTSRTVPQTANAPFAGGTASDGTVEIRVIDKDPVTETAPYTIQARSQLADGSSATYQAVVDVLSLLDFAVFSDSDINVGGNITISGRMYAGDDITLWGTNANFLQRVEYVDQLNNPWNGTFFQGSEQVEPLPSISALTNLDFFENASKNAGVCTSGIGIYIGDDNPVAAAQTAALFTAYEGSSPANSASWGANQAACRTGTPCYALDMTLFDFSATPITYGGNVVVDFSGNPITNFNGVIWADDEIHVWGHLGGRSIEENTVTDTEGYINPPFAWPNVYSNNRLDPGEDGNNGGIVNGILDPGNRGANLGIYTDSMMVIDHNIWAGTDVNGEPVRMALVARQNVRIDAYSPLIMVVEAATLSVTARWDPQGSHSDHQPNHWTNVNGDQPPNTYQWDLDYDGVIETNNGYGWADRDETDVYWAAGLLNLGNLVSATNPVSGHWASMGHPRFYTYDTQLQTAEIPCYPTLPNYGIVPGSFTEVLNAP
ncbi:MAG: hypothetical protein MJB57_01825 [Gemmatimonadetes bacterium]|nr:hypothetical protein [Gemmatimonadota bacterium]